jgi:hypothetical protein
MAKSRPRTQSPSTVENLTDIIVACVFAKSQHLLHASVIVTNSAFYWGRETYRFSYPKQLASRLGGNGSAMRYSIVVVSWILIFVLGILRLQYLFALVLGKLHELSLAILLIDDNLAPL